MLEGKKKECDQLAEQYAAEGYPSFASASATSAADPRRAVEGSPALDGQPARGHQHARVRQKDPKLEYQREGFGLFEEMNARIDAQTLELVFKFALPPPPDAPRAPRRARCARRRRPRRVRPRRDPRRAAGSWARPAQAKVAKVGPQRPVSVRQRQEVQEVPRRA
jgi:hypothetical protein